MTQSSPEPTRPHDHFVQFYEKDSFLLEEVSAFLGAGLDAGQSGLVIATPPHRAELDRRMAERAAAGAPLAPDQYVSLDAAETMSCFLVDGWPDERRFAEVVGGALRRAGRNGRSVRAFGEMVAMLWAGGQHEAAIRVEELWNGLARSRAFSLFCAYPMEGFHDEEHGDSFLRICDAHSAVRPAESFLESATPAELRRQVAILQQRAAALETEVAKRQERERALRRREEELADFLENAVVGLHQVGADGRILWANQAELDMLGYRLDEYIGHHIAEFHVDPETISDMLDKLQSGEPLHDQPARLRCKDGSSIHVRISSNALFADGEFIHTRCFTRDMTDRVRLEEELRRRVEQLAEEDRRKDEFLATLGHELRNPLSVILGGAEVMRLRAGEPAQVVRWCEAVARQSALMRRLIDDLLDVSRITRGKIELRSETVQLDAVVEQAVELVRPLMAERDHRLTVDLPAEPVSLSGDAARLVQILSNLLQNAAKYTDHGGSVALSALADGTALLIRVRDDGVGLSAEDRERVFEPFVQGPSSLDRAPGGLGVGLALVRGLVELHGGSVEALSDGPGRGSEFVVRLPLTAGSS